MYFRTNHYEYRYGNYPRLISADKEKIEVKSTHWQKRKLGDRLWESVSACFWNKIYNLRKTVIQNSRPTLAERARIKLNKHYDEQTKKTTKWAFKYGVPLDQIITR
jgi:hypothetical protein